MALTQMDDNEIAILAQKKEAKRVLERIKTYFEQIISVIVKIFDNDNESTYGYIISSYFEMNEKTKISFNDFIKHHNTVSMNDEKILIQYCNIINQFQQQFLLNHQEENVYNEYKSTNHNKSDMKTSCLERMDGWRRRNSHCYYAQMNKLYYSMLDSISTLISNLSQIKFGNNINDPKQQAWILSKRAQLYGSLLECKQNWKHKGDQCYLISSIDDTANSLFKNGCSTTILMDLIQEMNDQVSKSSLKQWKRDDYVEFFQHYSKLKLKEYTKLLDKSSPPLIIPKQEFVVQTVVPISVDESNSFPINNNNNNNNNSNNNNFSYYGPIRGVNKTISDVTFCPYTFTFNNSNNNNSNINNNTNNQNNSNQLDCRDMIINQLLQQVQELRNKHEQQQQQINKLVTIVASCTKLTSTAMIQDNISSNINTNLSIPIHFAPQQIVDINGNINHRNEDHFVVHTAFPIMLPSFQISNSLSNN